jgi:maltose-binding protein MalE
MIRHLEYIRERHFPVRTVRLVFMHLAAAAVAAGCQPAENADFPTPSPPEPSPVIEIPSPMPQSTEPVEAGYVRIWLDWTPEEMDGLNEVIRDFQSRYPEVRFAVAYHPTAQLEQDFRDAMQEGTGPTIIFGPSRWGPPFLEEGWIVDIQPLIDAELERIISPVAWTQGRQHRIAYGLPIELQGNLLYRNASLVEDEALTIDEFIDKAQELRRERLILTVLDYGLMYSGAQLSACGASLFDELGEFNFAGSGGECWLNLLKKLGRAGQIKFNVDEDRANFIAGQGAWLVGDSEQLDDLEGQLGRENLDVDSWPIYEETERALSGFVWSENAYLVSGETPLDQEVSWAFMRFLLTAEAQQTLSDSNGAGHLPVVNNIEVSDPLRAKALATLLRGTPLPLHEEFPLLAGPLERAIDAVAIQGADTKFSLAVAMDRIINAIEKAAQGS